MIFLRLFFTERQSYTLSLRKIITMASKIILDVESLGGTWQTLDPFLFSVHHLDYYPEGNESLGPKEGVSGRNIGQDFANKDGWNMYHGRRVPGFPYHPHRGFETVTVVEQGFADHSDSLGSTGRFGQGDVQWMTAGKGVQHAEMFPLLNPNGVNTLELFQIWLNLPADKKWVEPEYKMLWNEKIPVVEEKDSKGLLSKTKIISGQYKSYSSLNSPLNSWANDPENELAIWLVKIEAGGSYILPKSIRKGLNRSLYLFQGKGASFDGTNISNYNRVVVKSDSDMEIIAGNSEVSILVLQAKPIGEPVVKYGPFVMNTEQEIQDAYNSYKKTQFGGWPWPESEFVHPRETQRFAKFADGKTEFPG